MTKNIWSLTLQQPKLGHQSYSDQIFSISICVVTKKNSLQSSDDPKFSIATQMVTKSIMLPIMW